MKKTAALILTSAMMICSFASCSSAGSVVGVWEMKDLNDNDIKVGGLEFCDNGKGCIYMDTTNILHAEDKSIIIGSGEQAVQFDEDIIDYDGTSLKLTVQGQDLLTLEKTEGDKNEDSYDGKYNMKSGIVYDTIVGNIAKNSGKEEKEDLSVYISLDGSSSEVTFVDIFEYTAKKGKMEIAGYASFIGESADGKPVSVDYKIKDDIMTVTGGEGEAEELVRVK